MRFTVGRAPRDRASGDGDRQRKEQRQRHQNNFPVHNFLRCAVKNRIAQAAK
jgi:hypothetical protein